MIDANKLLLWLAALGVAVAGYFTFRQYERAVGARDATIANLRAKNETLKKVQRVVDTLYLHDKPIYLRAVANYDSAKATVEAKWLHDTIPVPVEVVKEIVRESDAVRKSCSTLVDDCEQRVKVRDDRITNLEGQVSILRASKPSILSRCGLSAGYGATEAAGRVYAGPSVLAGCRVFP